MDAKIILLVKYSSRATVFEELIHATQYRTGKCDGSDLSVALCEVLAKEKLLRYSKSYRLTDAEIRETEKILKGDRERLRLLRER